MHAPTHARRWTKIIVRDSRTKGLGANQMATLEPVNGNLKGPVCGHSLTNLALTAWHMDPTVKLLTFWLEKPKKEPSMLPFESFQCKMDAESHDDVSFYNAWLKLSFHVCPTVNVAIFVNSNLIVSNIPSTLVSTSMRWSICSKAWQKLCEIPSINSIPTFVWVPPCVLAWC